MRTVVAWLLATVFLLALRAPVVAAPPEDVAAYCRATYPQTQLQARCLDVENAAAERVLRAAASADRDAFNRCFAASPSWAAMASCLAQSARGVPMGGVPGVTSGVAPGTAGPAPTSAQGGTAAGSPAGAAAALPPVQVEGAGTPSPSTIILGPQPVAPSAGAAENRPTRTISEADADRHLRGVLERAGTPAAQCTKKQYGPGWVIICE